MSNSKMKRSEISVVLMKLQVGISALVVIFGIWFPLYISGKYGGKNLPLYDRFGSVIGEANYLAMSVGMGLFAVAIGAIGTILALNALKRMRPDKEEKKGCRDS